MRVVIEYFEKSKVFEDKHNITIGRDESSDFVINNLAENIEIKFIYNEKFKNYVLINSSGSSDVLVNNRNFSKVLTPAHFFLDIKGLSGKINVEIDTEQNHHSEVKNNQTQSQNMEQNKMEETSRQISDVNSSTPQFEDVATFRVPGAVREENQSMSKNFKKQSPFVTVSDKRTQK